MPMSTSVISSTRACGTGSSGRRSGAGADTVTDDVIRSADTSGASRASVSVAGGGDMHSDVALSACTGAVGVGERAIATGCSSEA